jgi:hypothetical protein
MHPASLQLKQKPTQPKQRRNCVDWERGSTLQLDMPVSL